MCGDDGFSGRLTRYSLLTQWLQGFALTKLVPLSERIVLVFPLLRRNLLKAMMNESLLMSLTTLRWTARVVRHVKIHPQIHQSLFRSLDTNCTKIVYASVGKGRIAKSKSFSSLLLLQRKHSLMILLTNDFPREIQNCWHTRASVSSPSHVELPFLDVLNQ